MRPSAFLRANSLLVQPGTLSVSTTQVAPPNADAARAAEAADAAAQLNLSREQLERMLVGQAQVLGVYGLPPVVAPYGEMGTELQTCLDFVTTIEAAVKANAVTIDSLREQWGCPAPESRRPPAPSGPVALADVVATSASSLPR